MQAHKFANATAEDFWGIETATSGKPVDRIMKSFVELPGEPLLTFAPASNGTLSVRQTRFFLTPKTDAPAQVWTFPVCAAGGSCDLVGLAESSVKPQGSGFENADAAGYYRTEYSPTLLSKVIAAAPSLKSTERISLISDRLALMHAGQSSVGDYLELVSTLRNEPNSRVLEQLLSGLGTVDYRIADDAQRKQLKAWQRHIFTPVYAALGPVTPNEDEQKLLLRVELFTLLGGDDDPAIIAEARAYANRSLAGDTTVNPQILGPSISIAAYFGDAALYDKLQQYAEAGTDPGKKTNALYTLAFFRSPALVTRTLDYATSGKVRNQDSWILIAILLSNPDTRVQAWNYVKSNWDKVQAQLTTASGASVVGSTGSFCSAADRDDVQQFFSTHKVAATDQALQHALESINSCIALRASQGPKLAVWLAAQSSH
jgi:aminopeptidase N/puromycin-sensitive aminopeptidase